MARPVPVRAVNVELAGMVAAASSLVGAARHPRGPHNQRTTHLGG